MKGLKLEVEFAVAGHVGSWRVEVWPLCVAG
jgi:hypothetical protein